MKPQAGLPVTVDDYIGAFPKDVRAILRRIRAAIRKAAPGAAEKISYRMPAYALNGRWVYFAAFKEHIGFYPGPDTIRAFAGRLAAYETSKGTVRFPIDEPMPLDLVAGMVMYRFGANAGRRVNNK